MRKERVPNVQYRTTTISKNGNTLKSLRKIQKPFPYVPATFTNIVFSGVAYYSENCFLREKAMPTKTVVVDATNTTFFVVFYDINGVKPLYLMAMLFD